MNDYVALSWLIGGPELRHNVFPLQRIHKKTKVEIVIIKQIVKGIKSIFFSEKWNSTRNFFTTKIEKVVHEV